MKCNGVSIKNIELKVYRTSKGLYYDNLAMLDVEVSSALLLPNGEVVRISEDNADKGEKISLLYLWNLCVDGYIFEGRDLDTLQEFLLEFNDRLEGSFFIYVHNLGYEFQFLRNIFETVNMFARKKRHPIKFNYLNFEFRCSYMLTRLSLETWAREKKMYWQKAIGDLDYEVIRTPYTFLSINEREYGHTDVLIGVEGLQDYVKQYGHVKNIPLTQTGRVRLEVNKRLKKDFKFRLRSRDMDDVSFFFYQFMIKAFIGGYTHANILYSDVVLHDLMDFDISSSYPWAMLSEKYPCEKFVSTKKWWRYLDSSRYAFIARFRFYNIESKLFNTYISRSKCIEIIGAVLDNGRVISADYVEIILLDVDFEIIKRGYNFDKITVDEFYYSTKRYLSKEIMIYILELFFNKTTLKGNDEMYNLMFKSKEEINSLYGMGVTKNITDDIVYTSDWDKDLLTEEKYYDKKEKKLRNIGRINLAYAQGIYVPAYGRKNLWSVVEKLDDIAVYMDTDSIKTLKFDDVLNVVSDYNREVRKKQEIIAEHLGIDVDAFRPKDYKGNVHSIGELERDRDICKFKTLGAKRYICEYSDSHELKMTVSGIRKKAVEQLNRIEDFSNKLIFTKENADKLLLYYNDNMPVGFTWNIGCYDSYKAVDRFGISTYKIGYAMTTNADYLELIKKYKENRTEVFVKRYGKEQ